MGLVMLAVTRLVCKTILIFGLLAMSGCRAGEADQLPVWLHLKINAQWLSHYPGTIEEARYHGDRVFLLTRGDRADTGDEHVLYQQDGREICVFGGFVGQVTSGECHLQEVIFVRTIFQSRAVEALMRHQDNAPSKPGSN